MSQQDNASPREPTSAENDATIQPSGSTGGGWTELGETDQGSLDQFLRVDSQSEKAGLSETLEGRQSDWFGALDTNSSPEETYHHPTDNDDSYSAPRTLDDSSGPRTDDSSGPQPSQGDSGGTTLYYDEQRGEWFTLDPATNEWVPYERDSSGSGYFDIDQYFDNEEEEFGDLENEGEDNDDTIPESTSKSKSPLDQSTPSPNDRRKTTRKSRKHKHHVNEMSKRSFRWFERRVLALQIPQSDENLRRKRLLEKCQVVRRVSRPTVAFDEEGPQVLNKDEEEAQETASKRTFATEDLGTAMSVPSFTDKEWAMKNTINFLANAGCSSSSGRTYSSTLKAARDTGDFRLALYEKRLQRRRKGIGNREQAPEITAALLRHAERAVWRAVIDNTKPRYPLPRFILPRHRYLKRVQSELIGPGSYDLDVYDAQVKLRQMTLPSTWATCTARFPKDSNEKDKKKEERDGAGTSYLLDPWEKLDKANMRHKYPGNYVPFESTPKNWRQMTSGEPGSRIPPNAYNIKSPMEEFIEKTTSLRGPYDCYTPSRSVIPYGYYQSAKDDEQCRLGPGAYEIRTSLVKEMHDPYNHFKGKLCKASRDKMFGFKAAFDNPLWPKENGIPPVGQYEVGRGDIGLDKTQNIAPFKVQSGLTKKDQKPELTAPDYYFFGKATWTVPPGGASLASVFSSRTPQIMLPKMHHVRKERNRALNKYCDVDGGLEFKEEHYAYDVPVKNTYVLEDCPRKCPGGPKIDPYANPGHGVTKGAVKSGGCCGC